MSRPCKGCPEWDEYGSCMQVSCKPYRDAFDQITEKARIVHEQDDGWKDSDPVNHPDHYQKSWGEVIQVTETLNFCLGNAIKYILRAEEKGNFEQDIRKAMWYLDRELKRRT